MGIITARIVWVSRQEGSSRGACRPICIAVRNAHKIKALIIFTATPDALSCGLEVEECFVIQGPEIPSYHAHISFNGERANNVEDWTLRGRGTGKVVVVKWLRIKPELEVAMAMGIRG